MLFHLYLTSCIIMEIEFRHRDVSAHACTAEDPRELAKSEASKKNATARQLLAKHFPQTQAGLNVNSKSNPVVAAASGSSSRTSCTQTNPKKAAQLRQVQAMKLRHKAQPGDPRDKGKVVALGEKLHLLVSLEGGDSKVFWFRKVIYIYIYVLQILRIIDVFCRLLDCRDG